MRFALQSSLETRFPIYLIMILFITQFAECGKLKDAIKAYKSDDIHSQCVSIDKMQEAQAQRDACRSRLNQIFTKNGELEIYIEEIKQLLEAREAEIISIRNEMSIRLALVENRVKRYTSQTNQQHIPQHVFQRPNVPVPSSHQQYPQQQQNFEAHQQRMHTPHQPQPPPPVPDIPPTHVTPRMISSESPAFQRMVRAHKSQNDLRLRQQRQYGTGGGQI